MQPQFKLTFRTIDLYSIGAFYKWFRKQVELDCGCTYTAFKKLKEKGAEEEIRQYSFRHYDHMTPSIRICRCSQMANLLLCPVASHGHTLFHVEQHGGHFNNPFLCSLH